MTVATTWRTEACTIELKGYVCQASIGIYAAEKSAPQRIRLDVVVRIDKAAALFASDQIGSVVDYDYLRCGIAQIVSSQHFELQETLCARILDLCFSKSEVIHATVSSAKLDIYPDCEAIGITVHASRAGGVGADQ